jgi:nucleoid-associated protein YgaU
VAPEQPPGGELDDPGFDPGGETQLPYETAPVPTPLGGDEEDSGDGAPLDVEPGVDLEGRLAPLAEPDTLATDAPVPPAEPVVPGDAVPPSAPDPSLGAGTTPPLAEQPAPDEQPEQDQGSTRDRKTADHHKARGPGKPGEERSGGGAPPQPAVTGEALEVAAAPAPPVPPAEPVAVAQTSPSAPETPEGSLRHARSYVVEPGDSLWSIAKRLLGPEASPARIAREVNRLWSLNHARIATGDPDLLMVGTRLRLE